MVTIGQQVGKLTVIDIISRGRGYTVSLKCECGRLVNESLSQVEKGKRKSCREEPCKRKFKRRRRHKGYVLIRIDGKDVFEHRVVMERLLGRKLTRSESVHHRNGVKDDNRSENLEMFDHGLHSGQHLRNQYLLLKEFKQRIHELEDENRRLRTELRGRATGAVLSG